MSRSCHRLGSKLTRLTILLIAAHGPMTTIAAPTAAPATVAPRVAVPVAANMIVGLVAAAPKLHPLAASSRTEIWVQELLTRAMATRAIDLSWTCDLCTEPPKITTSEVESTARARGRAPIMETRAVWQIAPNATWNDGTPITAADFQLAWEISLAAPRPSRAEAAWRGVSSFEPVAGKTGQFVLTWRGLRHDQRDLPPIIPIPAHIEGKIWLSSGNDWEAYQAISTYTTAPATRGLWSGSLAIVERSAGGASLRLAPSGTAGVLRVRNIDIRFHDREETLAAALGNGAVDLVPEGQLSGTDLQLAQERIGSLPLLRGRYRFVRAPGNGWEHVDFNMRNPLFGDRAVREAVRAAIDTAELARTVYGDPGIAQTTFLHGARKESATAAKAIDSAAEVTRILTSSGWKRSTDGQGGSWERDSIRLEFTLTWPRGDLDREKTALGIVAMLAKVGIRAVPTPEARDVFFNETLRKARFTGIALYGTMLEPGLLPVAHLHSREIPTLQNGYRGQNFSAFSLREVDEIIDNLPRVPDPAKRAANREQLASTWFNEVAGISLWLRPETAIVPVDLAGFRTETFQLPSSRASASWELNRKTAANP